MPLAYNNFAIGLGLVPSFLRFMILPLDAAIERFDFSLLGAAHDLHANRQKAFFVVVLSIFRPGLVAGGLRVFIPGIGNYLAPGWCQTNANSSQFPSSGILLGRKKAAPLSEGGGAVGREIRPAVDGALLMEMVVH